MDRNSLIFCVGSLVAFVVVAYVAFPYAAMAPEKAQAAETTVPAYNMGTVNVGEGFGEVPVEDLMAYYIDNPPADTTACATDAAAPEIRFGGC